MVPLALAFIGTVLYSNIADTPTAQRDGPQIQVRGDVAIFVGNGNAKALTQPRMVKPAWIPGGTANSRDVSLAFDINRCGLKGLANSNHPTEENPRASWAPSASRKKGGPD